MRWIQEKFVSFAARFRRPLIVALTAFIVSYVDPLGIEEATADRALGTIMRLSSTLYSGSGQVAVVLIDQAYLESQPNPAWPLSYGEQGMLLRQIANEKPKAVFVDLLYKNPHRNAPIRLTAAKASSANQLDVPADLLKPIQNTDVPFHFAALPKHGDVRGGAEEFDIESFSPGLDENGKLKSPWDERLALVAWSGFGDDYPLRLGRAGALRTPAYALYQHPCIPEQLPCANEDHRFDKPMKVRWGAFVPPNVAQHIKADVCQYTDSAHEGVYPNQLWLRLRALARQFVLAVVDRSNEATHVNSRLPCMSFVVLPASFLSDASGSRNAALIKAALQDKFVLVGADIPGIPDHTSSPVHGKTAGVMLHAMAMDNLLTAGSGYVRATPEWFSILFKLLVLCAVAIWAASRPIKEDGFVNATFIVIGVCAWIGCAAFEFMHDHTARGMLFLIGGAVITWFASAETGRVVGLFMLICALALIVIEFGLEPTNWIVLAVAASFVQQVVRRLPPTSEGEGK